MDNLAAFLTDVGTFLTQGVTWMKSILAVIGEEPILFVMVVATSVAGWGIGGLKRLIRL